MRYTCASTAKANRSHALYLGDFVAGFGDGLGKELENWVFTPANV